MCYLPSCVTTKIHFRVNLELHTTRCRKASCSEQSKIYTWDNCTGEVLQFLPGWKPVRLWSEIRIVTSNDSIKTNASYFYCFHRGSWFMQATEEPFEAQPEKLTLLAGGFVVSLWFKNPHIVHTWFLTCKENHARSSSQNSPNLIRAFSVRPWFLQQKRYHRVDYKTALQSQARC